MRLVVEECLPGAADDAEGLRTLVRSNPLPVWLVRLEDRAVVEVSDALATLLGCDRRGLLRRDVTDFIVDREPARARLALLASGELDSYRVLRRGLRRVDGREVVVDVCAGTVTDDQCRLAVGMMLPVDDRPHLVSTDGRPSDQVRARQGRWPVGGSDVVVLGTVDGEWRIDRVSTDIEQLLGYDVAHVVGQQVSTLVHPSDLPGLLIALGHGMRAPGGASLRLHLRDAGGEWRLLRALITPLASRSAPEFGFAFAFAEVSAANVADRTGDELRGHLERIAREVAATGVLSGLLGAPTAAAVPAVAGLTWRELEIVTGLQAGERVPMISRRLFLSPSTVRNHLTSVYRKLGVSSQQELLTLLREEGDAPPKAG